jgi:hypothetical protein
MIRNVVFPVAYRLDNPGKVTDDQESKDRREGQPRCPVKNRTIGGGVEPLQTNLLRRQGVQEWARHDVPVKVIDAAIGAISPTNQGV